MNAATSVRAGRKTVLVVNPNSNPAVSNLLRDAACRALPPTVHAKVVNPADGPLSIETEAQKAEAVPRVIDIVRSSFAVEYGALAMGCFDDLALHELREIIPVPVIGTFEAGLLHVRSYTAEFGIVTTFDGALPGIADLLGRYGAQECVGVRAAGVGVAAAARSDKATEDRIELAVREAIESDGAKAILLGSGGLTGWAPRLERKFRIPVVDGVESAIRIAGAIASRRS